jgi:phospholipase C
MKVFSRALLAVLSTACLATFATAQTIPIGTFKHIIIVIQENRTPDNLFGAGAPSQSGCGLRDQFEPGVDITNRGQSQIDGTICNLQQPMNTPTLDPGHFYHDWTGDYDGGAMDGFCHTYTNGITKYVPCRTTPPSPYSYIQLSDVQPYFDISKAYGFANYMFQTNEGPSFPAHQFLFTGTSAPVAPKDSLNYYLDFVADNPPKAQGFNNSGCPASGVDGYPLWNLPTGLQETDPRVQPNECYTHDSLVTNASGDKGVSWRYYTPTISNPGNPLGIIWDAPEGIPEVCYGQNQATGTPCQGSEFTSHVVYPGEKQFGFNYDSAPVLDDIANCKLQQISWVVPDTAWSDHPFSNVTNSPPYGPSWVGNIINAVGQSYANSGGKCDYWGFGTGSTSPEPTAIFVVWDDWGGFYDHVAPPVALEQNPQPGYTNCDPNSQWGCGYVYGFRVPLLVVSEYTQAGYVSGAFPSPGKISPYVHDFGSILAFTEHNFGMNFVYPGTVYYADFNAPDWSVDHKTVVPLMDFFGLSNQRTFTPISTPYPPSKFKNYYTTLQNGAYPTPTGPDGTPGEED